MKYFNPNSPEFIVGDALPLTREILKASHRLAFESASKNSQCSTQEYLTHLTNAVNVLSVIVANNLNMDS